MAEFFINGRACPGDINISLLSFFLLTVSLPLWFS